jgi:glycosyltransferase involved in cell wall biosynthesis
VVATKRRISEGVWKLAETRNCRPTESMNVNNDIRVLMVDSETTWRGGEGQLFLLISGLIDEGFHVSLAAPPHAVITDRVRGLGVECLPLPISGGLDLGAAWKLRGYLRQRRYDVIHTHSSHAHSVAFMAERASRVRASESRPLLVVSRRVDFRVATNGLSALKYRHGADVYVAISEGVRDVLIECDIDPGRIELVRSGIDLNKFATVKDPGYLRDEFGIEPDSVVIGNVAALAPHKSQVDFLRAAAHIASRVDKVRFFVVGEGELRASLERQAQEIGVGDRVTFTGFRPDVLEFIALFDCFVLSSYLEGLCTSIMDAQYSGTPVVATRTGGIPDLVQDGVTGLLVPPRNPDALAAAVVRMVQNRNFADACVAAAKEKARGYGCEHMVAGTISVYERALRAVAEVQ